MCSGDVIASFLWQQELFQIWRRWVIQRKKSSHRHWKKSFFYQGCCAQCHRRQGSTVGEDQSCNIILRLSFLAVQNSSIGDLVTDWLTHSTFTFDIQRTTLETCDLWNIWSEWWGDMTWDFFVVEILTFLTFFDNSCLTFFGKFWTIWKIFGLFIVWQFWIFFW